MPIVGQLHHDTLGLVIVSVRPNNQRATARWRNGCVSLNVPIHYSMGEIHRLLDTFAPKLLETRPTLSYTIPSVLHLHGLDIKLTRQDHLPDKATFKAALPVSTIEIGRDIDVSTPAGVRFVSSVICGIAKKVAAQLILPRAHHLARKIGKAPGAWTISTGFRTLGSCSSHGLIALSYALVFLPVELRDYVILHELAHLSEMNHSPRFHALLNTYLDGREGELVARLRSYSWPVLRK